MSHTLQHSVCTHVCVREAAQESTCTSCRPLCTAWARVWSLLLTSTDKAVWTQGPRSPHWGPFSKALDAHWSSRSGWQCPGSRAVPHGFQTTLPSFKETSGSCGSRQCPRRECPSVWHPHHSPLPHTPSPSCATGEPRPALTCSVNAGIMPAPLLGMWEICSP